MEFLKSLPHGTVLLDEDSQTPYTRDESHVQGCLPLAVVKPRSAEDLRELAAVAKREGLALVSRGAGTGKAGGCTPLPGRRSIIVDMSQWPGEIQVSRADMTLWAPASAYLKDIKAAAGQNGLFYPPDPNSWDQCSFGGSLATNAGGPCAAKYGMTRHFVLSVDALMADGEIHRFGISTVKNNAGPNLAQLMVGSEGIFGIIVGATVRLLPRPKELLTLLLPVEDWYGLLDLPTSLVGSGLLPSAFEFWDRAVLDLLREHGPEEAKRLPGRALALLEFDDPGCAGEDFLERVLEALGPLAEHAQSATEEGQREQLWAVRRQTSAILKELHPGKVSEDIVVPRSKVRAFFEGVEAKRLPLVAYGHLGDGNLHVNFLAAQQDKESLEVHIMELFRLCLSLGGALSGEHGIGIAKRAAFLELADPFQIEALRAIKRSLDPEGIFNPGKVI